VVVSPPPPPPPHTHPIIVFIAKLKKGSTPTLDKTLLPQLKHENQV